MFRTRMKPFCFRFELHGDVFIAADTVRLLGVCSADVVKDHGDLDIKGPDG